MASEVEERGRKAGLYKGGGGRAAVAGAPRSARRRVRVPGMTRVRGGSGLCAWRFMRVQRWSAEVTHVDDAYASCLALGHEVATARATHRGLLWSVPCAARLFYCLFFCLNIIYSEKKSRATHTHSHSCIH